VTDEIKALAVHLADKASVRVLVPDLYRGKLGVDKEEAHHLMSNLDFPNAIKVFKKMEN
jgi:carboxymethylenebutenolidase